MNIIVHENICKSIHFTWKKFCWHFVLINLQKLFFQCHLLIRSFHWYFILLILVFLISYSHFSPLLSFSPVPLYIDFDSGALACVENPRNKFLRPYSHPFVLANVKCHIHWLGVQGIYNQCLTWYKNPFYGIKVKKTTAKTDQTTSKRLRCTIFRLANTNLHRAYWEKPRMYRIICYCKITNGSYMVWRGKVWLLRKINRKQDKDYIMIIVRHVCDWQRVGKGEVDESK